MFDQPPIPSWKRRKSAALYEDQRKISCNSVSNPVWIQIPAAILMIPDDDDIIQIISRLIMVSGVHAVCTSWTVHTDLHEAKQDGRISIYHQLRLT